MWLRKRAVPRVDTKHLLMLKGLLLWAVIPVAFLAGWHYGLLQRVWMGDSTGLSIAITLVFLGVAGHGSWHILQLSRALNHVVDVRTAITSELPPEVADRPGSTVCQSVASPATSKACRPRPRSAGRAR